MQFRPSINALRAIAVICVVLFHFRVPGFVGGYIGVDIFFVISGYLMTGIILGRRERDRFSLRSFYASRARRIIPALLGLGLALGLFGFLYLPGDDYRSLLRDISSSLLFVSNFSLAKSGDYFAAAPQENWLLHTWSLSLEWQFYLLYPLLLLGCRHYFGPSRNLTATLILALALLSFLASALLTPSFQAFAFYLLPTRAWELLIGGVLFLYPLSPAESFRPSLEAAGLACIGLGLFWLDEQAPWPGVLALIPVAGAALVILANADSPLGRNAPLQFIGKISYSLYLWHWPVVVFLYLCGLMGDSWALLAGLTATLFLGSLSYFFIERPASNRLPGKRLKPFLVPVALVVVSAQAMAELLKVAPGVRFHFHEPTRPAYESQLVVKECLPNEFNAVDCRLGTGEIAVILLGDSHAQATAAAVQAVNPGSALLWALGGCPTLKHFSMRDSELATNCRAFNESRLKLLRETYPGVPVLLFSRTALYLDRDSGNRFRVHFDPGPQTGSPSLNDAFVSEYAHTVCAIAQTNPVWIVKPLPEMPFNIYKGLHLRSRFFSTGSDIAIPISAYLARNQVALDAIARTEAMCGVHSLDPTPYLCPEDLCLGTKNGVPLYFDDNHLVDAGNLLLGDLFSGLFPRH